jgi:hypothetical protein
MFYRRVHSNGFEVIVRGESAPPDCWTVQVITYGPNGERSNLLGLKTTTLERAKKVGDSVAVVNHQCNEECEEWRQEWAFTA